ncbi:hypothetical protein [Paenibacillus glacialis]|uniref:Uncharacterized protein n=1 Tax=Paenibacillus glacialis TaxID=494026 RepID=A0A168NP11_9BACL|nr:hypothetical protein [Paenibacillus glacialis]OAB45983.1 hypothetical protein PGLA_00880 [Paenibacillus glacialis]
MTNPTLNQRPEVTPYYAAVPTDKVSDRGNIIFNEYLFLTLEEAMQSGLDYKAVTWTDINMLADSGHCFEDMIINTPQGRFEWVTQYECDYDDEEIETDCTYRYVGAPEVFSEEIEEFLFYNKEAELISISDVDSGDSRLYTASINNLGEPIEIQFRVNC